MAMSMSDPNPDLQETGVSFIPSGQRPDLLAARKGLFALLSTPGKHTRSPSGVVVAMRRRCLVPAALGSNRRLLTKALPHLINKMTSKEVILFIWRWIQSAANPSRLIFPDEGKFTGNFRLFPADPSPKRLQPTVIPAILSILRKPLEFITGNYQGIHQYH
jgi:hypothetical protein